MRGRCVELDLFSRAGHSSTENRELFTELVPGWWGVDARGCWLTDQVSGIDLAGTCVRTCVCVHARARARWEDRTRPLMHLGPRCSCQSRKLPLLAERRCCSP